MSNKPNHREYFTISIPDKPRIIIPTHRTYTPITKHVVKPTAKQMTVFEGDESWYYKLDDEFEFMRWIIAFFGEFNHLYDPRLVDQIGKINENVKTDLLSTKLYSCPAIFDALYFTTVETNYWEGPGPVSGDTSRVTINADKKVVVINTIRLIVVVLYKLVLEKLFSIG